MQRALLRYKKFGLISAFQTLLLGSALSISVNIAEAKSVSYFLDQSNTLADGVNYLEVTIDDQGTAGYINFTVKALPSLTGIAISKFGIKDFGFNVTPGGTLPPDSKTNPNVWKLPPGWSANAAPPPNAEDGFGKFDVAVSTTGTNITPELHFSVLSNNDLSAFLDLSIGNAAQGNAYFAAQVINFDNGAGVTGGYFGATSLTEVPLPAPLALFASALLALAGIVNRKD